VVGCDLTFGSPQSKSRDLRRDRFRQFTVATRFDTLWAINRHSPVASRGRSDVGSPQEERKRQTPIPTTHRGRARPTLRLLLSALALLLTGCVGGGMPYTGRHLSPTECRDLAALKSNTPPHDGNTKAKPTTRTRADRRRVVSGH
jgi:hypothetical protein